MIPTILIVLLVFVLAAATAVGIQAAIAAATLDDYGPDGGASDEEPAVS